MLSLLLAFAALHRASSLPPAALHRASLHRASPLPTARQSIIRMCIESCPVIIVPGFGNADIDYVLPLEQPEDTGLRAALTRRGFTDVRVLPVERYEWAKVIFGLLFAIIFGALFPKAATPSGPAYSWFIDRLRAAVEEAHVQSGGDRVLLIGHSAGGWLARAMLANGEWLPSAGAGELPSERAADLVSGLVTLGTPHFPPPEGVPDMTQGVLKFVNDEYPAAFLADDGIAYVTVGGDAIVGDNSRQPASAGSASRVAYNSYEMVCGRGDVRGDGVVPLSYTLLEGAAQLTLDGVLHSINEAGTTLPTDRWYGSEKVVDRWLPAVRTQVAHAERQRSGGGGASATTAAQKTLEKLTSGLRTWASEQAGGPRK